MGAQVSIKAATGAKFFQLEITKIVKKLMFEFLNYRFLERDRSLNRDAILDVFWRYYAGDLRYDY